MSPIHNVSFYIHDFPAPNRVNQNPIEFLKLLKNCHKTKFILYKRQKSHQQQKKPFDLRTAFDRY